MVNTTGATYKNIVLTAFAEKAPIRGLKELQGIGRTERIVTSDSLTT